MHNKSRRQFIKSTAAALSAAALPVHAVSSEKMRVGIVGLDTSHAPAFAELFSSGKSGFEGFQVVAACAKGSEDIPSSVNRIPEYTEKVKKYGVEIVPSVAEVIRKSDVILLETNDGRPHLRQAIEVIQAGKKLFIDKPVAASFKDVKSIYAEAEKWNVPVFSSSSLRYLPAAQAVRYQNRIGKVLACDAYSPATLEPTHPDLFWYGIHGVEILFTVMGAGCETVQRTTLSEVELVVGKWRDGRIGTFRGMRVGLHDYGGFAFGSSGNLSLGSFEGYEPLAKKIAEFFRTGISPVDPAETIEIYAFMDAAERSKQAGGKSVTLF